MSNSVSLIVPLAAQETIETEPLIAFQRELASEPGITSVEVIVAGGRPDPEDSRHGAAGLKRLAVEGSFSGDGKVAALRRAIDEATGEVLIVLDPSRAYRTEACASVLRSLRDSSADLAIGVPLMEAEHGPVRKTGRRLLGLVGQASFGTADVFSGLMAVRRKHLFDAPTSHPPRGSRLVLDLLAWPCRAHRDVPVPTADRDRLRLLPLHFDDLRQLKRVWDQRFGTFSRLVQFCVVGASGMVVDLSLYACFQIFLAMEKARALAIFIALIWNFSLNRRLTFNDTRGGSIPRQFATYVLGNSLGILVSYTLSIYLPRSITFFDQHKLAAAVVGIVMATGISFSMSRWVVFTRRTSGSSPAELPADALANQAALPEEVVAS
ncbi:MAG: GtrA family protein [Isosphaeraceae bacterium]